MTYEDGWEREYTRAVKTVSSKPVLLVGRITRPDVAEELLVSGDADAILLARQMFADAEWAAKAREGRDDDIRRCVAANYCWRSVIRGGRVQCIYNPEIGRERAWGAGTLERVADAKRVLVAGAGPAGLEYARVAAARGHEVVVLECEEEVGGHVRSFSKLPGRAPFYGVAQWLSAQARGNGAEIRVGEEATVDWPRGSTMSSSRPARAIPPTASRARPPARCPAPRPAAASRGTRSRSGRSRPAATSS